MREIDKKIDRLAQKLFNGEITPEEHVKQYNQLIQEENAREDHGWQPHEHI